MIKRLHRAACTLFCLASLAATAAPYEEYALAAQQFAQLSTAAASQHGMPRRSDPLTAQVLNTLADHKRFLDTQTFSGADMSSLNTMCTQANQIVIGYLLYDLAAKVDKSITDPQRVAAAVAAVGARNALTYQDEMTPVMAFNLRCQARQMPLLAELTKNLKPEEMTDERRAGLEQMRKGLMQAYLGTAQSAGTPEIRFENRRQMMSAMADVTPSFSQVLDLERREAALKFWLMQAANMPPEFSTQYQQVITALRSTQCDIICSISSK